MPELPDVTVYKERLEAMLVGEVLQDLRIRSPFLLRSVTPAPEVLHGQQLLGVERLGKRLVFVFADEHFLVLHLMIAGRLKWHPGERRLGSKIDLCAFDFELGTLLLTEAGSKKRASLHVVAGREGLEEFDRGGLEVLGATPEQLAQMELKPESITAFMLGLKSRMATFGEWTAPLEKSFNDGRLAAAFLRRLGRL